MIPAFDEERRLPPTLATLAAGLDDLVGPTWEVLVSDDGSTDATAEVVRRAGDGDERIRLVRSPENRGKGAALVAGAREASHPLLLLLDADLPVPLATIAELAARADGHDLVVGSRRLPGARFTTPQPLKRRVGGRLFLAEIRLLGFRPTSDPQCGVKLLRREALAEVLDAVVSPGFGFDVELIARARAAGLRIADHPVAWRHVEGSSLRPVRDALRTTAELVRLRRAPGAERRAGGRPEVP